MNRLAGKIALITGGAMGIGRSACLLMAGEGAKVAVTDVADDRGRALAQEIRGRGGEAEYWQLDVSDEGAVSRVFAEVERRFGAITALVNNAGIGGANKPTHELSVQEWEQVQAVNVKGVFLCTKYAIPQMKRAGGGRNPYFHRQPADPRHGRRRLRRLAVLGGDARRGVFRRAGRRDPLRNGALLGEPRRAR